MVRTKRPAALLDVADQPEPTKPKNAKESLPGEGTPKAPVPVVKVEPGQFPPIPKRDPKHAQKAGQAAESWEEQNTSSAIPSRKNVSFSIPLAA